MLQIKNDFLGKIVFIQEIIILKIALIRIIRIKTLLLQNSPQIIIKLLISSKLAKNFYVFLNTYVYVWFAYGD